MVQENILNVTLLEPRQKHPTIFARFDALEGGENVLILNDHDPKPLYYQLMGERGDVFKWEYLEQGPQWWKVRITKHNTGEGSETLGEIAAKDIRKARVFKQYGLDFCCGGKKTVKEACAEKGLDVTRIEQELQQAGKTRESQALPFNEWELGFLADYIVNTHHSYIRKSLPDLRAFSKKVMQVHGSRHQELVSIHEIVEQVFTELTDHMEKEEKVLFPLIKALSAAAKNEQHGPHPAFVGHPIRKMETEHEWIGNAMAQIRELSKDYSLPADACTSYSVLYQMLDEFEADLLLHIHLENNILFPKALALEDQLSK